jgi:hypothetical protein
VYYKLIDPAGVLNQLRHSTKKLDPKDIARTIKADSGALARALEGERVWASTIEKIAEAIHENPADIAKEA